MAIHSWFNRVWYGGQRTYRWLIPWSIIYGGLVHLRRAAYRFGLRKTTQVSIPVIVVGNLSVGGTGKTPLVCWLVLRLKERGFKPGVVTRGYKGASHPHLVLPGDDANMEGDEPLLLARHTSAPVAVGRNRPAAAQLLVAAGCDVVISDDGLQHYALARDCEILVIDGERRFGNGWLLPAGPLREPVERMQIVDVVVVNGVEAGVEAGVAGAVSMHLQASSAIGVLSKKSVDLYSFQGKSVHAVAGIGNPARFFKLLRAFGINVVPHPMSDHARPRRGDIVFADDLPVFMTEKDAVKCEEIADERHWQIPVDACFNAIESSTLLDTVMRKIALHNS